MGYNIKKRINMEKFKNAQNARPALISGGGDNLLASDNNGFRVLKSGKFKVESGKFGLSLQDRKSEDRKTVNVMQSCSHQSYSLNTNNFQFSTLNFPLSKALMPSNSNTFKSKGDNL